MSKPIKGLLLVECAVLLFPLFRMIFILLLLLYDLVFRGDGSYDMFGPTLAMFFLIALTILYPVCRGILALLLKVLMPNLEVLSAMSIKIRIACGFVLAAFIFISEWTQTRMDIYDVANYVMPVLCVVHLMWLGRNYLFGQSTPASDGTSALQ